MFSFLFKINVTEFKLCINLAKDKRNIDTNVYFFRGKGNIDLKWVLKRKLWYKILKFSKFKEENTDFWMERNKTADPIRSCSFFMFNNEIYIFKLDIS